MSRSRSALRAASVAAASVLLCAPSASACTNLLVSQGASHDASTILAYNADSGSLYGSLGHYPATDNNPPNATREVWDWDDSVFLGVIPEARRTFNVIGNANERGLVIGETTFGGLPELDCHGTGGVMDYGSLIWIALQRAETCAEAIDVIDSLVQTYGYASDGESFSCVDGAEAWLMELVGKGEHERGAVWVATRVPEGAVLAHANQARTTTFDMNDPVNVRYSPDVVSFARAIGRYPVDASDDDFDFSAAYDPVTFGGARHGDARVWDIYRRLEGEEAMEPYREYARGYNLTNRLPLFAYPAARLDVESAMAIMRTKLEDTWFDTRGTHRADVGAGPGHSAYRFRPLTWRDSAGRAFVNERTVATQQTAWNFVAESRLRFPKPIAAIQWWAPDDSGTALRVPVYGGAARVPYNFADAVGQVPAAAVDAGNAPDADASRPSLDSAFWIWNLAASLAYGERADVVAPLLARELDREQSRLLRLARDADAELAGVVEQELVEAATTFVEKVAAGRVRAMARRVSQTLRRDARRVSHHAERHAEVRPGEIQGGMHGAGRAERGGDWVRRRVARSRRRRRRKREAVRRAPRRRSRRRDEKDARVRVVETRQDGKTTSEDGRRVRTRGRRRSAGVRTRRRWSRDVAVTGGELSRRRDEGRGTRRTSRTSRVASA